MSLFSVKWGTLLGNHAEQPSWSDQLEDLRETPLFNS